MAVQWAPRLLRRAQHARVTLARLSTRLAQFATAGGRSAEALLLKAAAAASQPPLLAQLQTMQAADQVAQVADPAADNDWWWIDAFYMTVLALWAVASFIFATLWFNHRLSR